MNTESIPSHLKKFPKGFVFFKDGDFNRDLYIIHSGKVRVFKQLGIKTINITELGKGSVFGEISAIDGGPRSATVQAVEDTEIYMITPPEFASQMKRMPEWFSKIAMILSQRLRETDHLIEREVSANNEYNICILLSYLAVSNEVKDEKDEKTLILSLETAENEIRNLLRTESEFLEAFLNRLKNQSLIDIRDGRIIISDTRKLEEFAEKIQKEADKKLFV